MAEPKHMTGTEHVPASEHKGGFPPFQSQTFASQLVWLVIAMSSTFAGNLTVLGSMASLIVAERAAARGAPMRFMDFVWTGVPITVLTIAWGIVALVALR